MRLRGNMINVPLIYNIASSLDKFEKVMLIKFLPDTLELVLQSNLESGMSINSRLPTRKVFSDYVLEPGEAPGIYIEMGSELLTRALKSSADTLTTFRAAKREGCAFLKINTTHRCRTKGSVALSQDIPIRILTYDQIKLVNEFQIPSPTIQFRLPKLDQLRHEVNRIKNVADQVTILANLKGDLSFWSLTDSASVKIGFKDIPALDFSLLPEEFYLHSLQYQTRDKEAISEIKVGMRDLVRSLLAPVLNPLYTVCGIVEGRMLTVTCVLITPLQESLGMITFCLPAIKG